MPRSTFAVSSRTRRASAWLCAGLAAAGLSGCGAASSDADPAKVAPQGSVVYLTGVVRPEGDQKTAVDAIASKVFGKPNPGAEIQRLVDEQLADDPETRGTTYAKDVAPWLGDRAAVAITGFAGQEAKAVAIVTTKDAARAKEFVSNQAASATPRLAKRAHEGQEYWFNAKDSMGVTVLGDYVLLGSEPSVRAAITASKNEGLDAKPAYEEVAGDAASKLGFGYVDVKGLLNQLNSTGQLPPGSAQTLQGLVGTGAKPTVMSLDAAATALTLEVVARGVPARGGGQQPPALVGALPGDAWAAIGAPRVGESLRGAVAQLRKTLGEALVNSFAEQVRTATGLDIERDVIAALGDLALFVSGDSVASVAGGIVVQATDPAAARRLVDRLRALIDRQGAAAGVTVADANIPGAQGFRVSSAQIPGAVNVVVAGDKLVIAYGDAAAKAALAPTAKLADAADYKAAQQSLGGAAPSLFVSFAPLAQLVGATGEPDAQQASRYLRGLRTLAAGAKTQGDKQTSRFVLTVK